MSTFHVSIGYQVSQSITVEADDYQEAIDLAFDELEYPNSTNKFEESGEATVQVVYGADGTLLYEGGE